MGDHIEPNRVKRDYRNSIAYVVLKNIAFRQENVLNGMIDTVKDESSKEALRSALGVVNSFGAHVDYLSREAVKTNPTLDIFDTKLLLNVELYLKSTQKRLLNEDAELIGAFNKIIKDVIAFFRIYSRTGRMPDSFANV